MIDPDIPVGLREAIDRQLAEGEAVVWLEQPYPGTLYRKIRFSLIAGLVGFGVASAGMSLFSGRDAFGLSFGGACFLLAVIFAVRRPATYIAYAITDRRLLIVMFGAFGQVISKSYTPDMLGTRRVKLDDQGKGGTIWLEDRDTGEHENTDLVYTRDLRDVRATAAAIDHLVQSSSKPSL